MLQPLTESELTVMELMWNSDVPIGSYEILKNTTFKGDAIGRILRNLRKKNIIRPVGTSKTIRIRTIYEPTITKAEWIVESMKDYLNTCDQDELNEISKKIENYKRSDYNA